MMNPRRSLGLLSAAAGLVFLGAGCGLRAAGADASGAAESWQVVTDEDGRFWLATPEGDPFFSIGVNHIVEAHDFQPPPGTTYYDPIPTVFGGDEEAWRASSRALLTDNGFNTIGAWSSPVLNDGSLYDMPVLYVAGHAQERVLSGLRDDFEEIVRSNIRAVKAEIAEPDKVVGVFLDNEMAWFGRSPWDNNKRYTILEHALTLEEDNVERGIVMDFLKEQYPTATAFADAWGVPVQEWSDVTSDLLQRSVTQEAMADRERLLAKAADAFYGKAGAVVREEMPGVLLLGTRFAGDAPDPVIEAAGRHSDIVSYNHYRPEPRIDERLAARYWLLTRRPLMITEYSWRAEENTSGNPNTGGAGSVVKTQADRGEAYAAWVADAASYPMIVGLHWFEFSDQSPQGRFDGENSNYGMVDIYHRPYEDLLLRMREANATLEDVRSASDRPFPTKLPDPPAALFEPGQYPGRPASIDLLAVTPAADPDLFYADDAEIALQPAEEGLLVDVQTGTTWGCGFLLFGPEEWMVPGTTMNATNLDGYTQLVIEGTLPAGQEMQVIIDEAGVASPNAPSYDTSAGDDGESYAFEPVMGDGTEQTWTFPISTVSPRGVWGNQRGEGRVDTQALRGIALVFLPGPEADPAHIRAVRLEK